jgi:hypothetical protein
LPGIGEFSDSNATGRDLSIMAIRVSRSVRSANCLPVATRLDPAILTRLGYTPVIQDAGFRESRFAILAAPSVIIPDEVDYCSIPHTPTLKRSALAIHGISPSTRGFRDTRY